jgi:hypothetical protein
MMVGCNVQKEFSISLLIQDLKVKMPRQEVKAIFDQVRAVGEHVFHDHRPSVDSG